MMNHFCWFCKWFTKAMGNIEPFLQNLFGQAVADVTIKGVKANGSLV